MDQQLRIALLVRLLISKSNMMECVNVMCNQDILTILMELASKHAQVVIKIQFNGYVLPLAQISLIFLFTMEHVLSIVQLPIISMSRL